MFVYFILIFLFSCTANSSKIGKCDQLVADFALDLEYDITSDDTISKCRKVLECFGSLNTTYGDTLKSFYEFRCEKYEFYKIGGTRCFDHILNDQIWRKNILPRENSDLRSNLLFAKSSILDIASRKCSKAFQNYLAANYTQFVDYWAVSPKNDSCESLHVELKSKEYLFLSNMIVHNWKVYINGSLRISVEPKDRSFAIQTCQRFNALNDWQCQPYIRQEELVVCENIDAITSEFYNCAKKLGTSRDRVSFRKCDPSHTICVKETMRKECGEVSDFNKYYSWFSKNKWRQPQVFGVEGGFLRTTIYFLSPIQINSEWENCARFVDEMVSVLSRNKEVKSENVYGAEKTSGEVTNCYKKLHYVESRSLQKLFQIIWDKSTFSSYGMFKCVDKFLRIQRVKKNSPFLAQCMNTCPTPDTPKLKKWCKTSKEGSIYFYACLEKIRQEEHLLPADHCGRTEVRKTKYDDGYVFQFNNKKECLKGLMQEKCDKKALENFDDHFERSQADYTLNE